MIKMGRECPECGSDNIEERSKGFIFPSTYYICLECGWRSKDL